MAKVKIVTDSNSGITQSEAEKLGISVLPMPFLIDGEEYFEDINLTQTEFYAHLKGDASVSTSQPAIGNVTELWEGLLADGSEVVHIPMSSGLSMSCQSAIAQAKEYGGRVQVVDNLRISVTQKQSVIDAIKLANEGKSAAEIKAILEKMGRDSSIYISLDTLKYLKKGGRLTPAAALIGTLLKLRPVLQIQGDKLDKFNSTVKSVKKAREVMIDALRNDLGTRFAEYRKNGEMTISVAHTDSFEEAQSFAEELKAAFPDVPLTFIDPLSLSVACHIGPGSLACTCTRVLK